MLSEYPNTPRLINRFSLGADPEWALCQMGGGGYVFAENLGLTTLTAFGCDMSGRQAEIRAYPSKFALEVVASIADTLRWLGWACPAALACNWLSLAFNGRDGFGGHLHFGRLHKGRNEDADMLDAVVTKFLRAGIINAYEFGQRAAQGHYGQRGDIRANAHGYEYRTLPTQLSSPWMTYFQLVVSKLAILEGKKFKVELANSATLEPFRCLLQRYQFRDDDATIALAALEHSKWPLPTGAEDFKQAWGVPSLRPQKVVDVPLPENCHYYFPSMICPEHQTCEELFDRFTRGVAMPRRFCKPTWQPFVLPPEFSCVTVQPHTLGHAPDVAMNLVSCVPINIQVHNADNRIYVYTDMLLDTTRIQEALKHIAPVRFAPAGNRVLSISLPTAVNKSVSDTQYLHRLLSTPNLFPTCLASKLCTTDFSKWEKVQLKKKAPSEPPKMLGKKLKTVGQAQEAIPKAVNAAQVIPVPGQQQQPAPQRGNRIFRYVAPPAPPQAEVHPAPVPPERWIEVMQERERRARRQRGAAQRNNPIVD